MIREVVTIIVGALLLMFVALMLMVCFPLFVFTTLASLSVTATRMIIVHSIQNYRNRKLRLAETEKIKPAKRDKGKSTTLLLSD